VDFERLGITGTPTLLLADKNGKIIGSWLGQLSSDKETDVMNAINATN
jgi:thioredoxin-related protein